MQEKLKEQVKGVEEAYINKQFAGKISNKDSLAIRSYRFKLQDILLKKGNERYLISRFITNLKDKVTKLEDKEREIEGYGKLDRSKMGD